MRGNVAQTSKMEAFGVDVLKNERNVAFTAKLELSDCTCPICMCILIQPVTMPCGHELCLQCFNAHVHGTSLRCPMCRKWLASWTRKGARNNKLVNERRWQQIKLAFPKKVQSRLDGIEDDSDEEFSSVRHVSEPGAIRHEYLQQMEKLAQERVLQRKEEEEASQRLIQNLQAVEREEQLSAERQQVDDQTLAKQLWSTTNTTGNTSKIATSMEKFVEKAKQTLETVAKEYTPTDTGKVISADMVTTKTYPYVSDEFLNKRGMNAKTVAPEQNGHRRLGSLTDFIYISDSPMPITIDETPRETSANSKHEDVKVIEKTYSVRSLIEKTPLVRSAIANTSLVRSVKVRDNMQRPSAASSGVKMREWLSTNAVKKKDVAATVSKAEPQAGTSTAVEASRCNSQVSEDSISIELNHFRPVRTFPLTPPKRLADGSLLKPIIVQSTPRYLSFSQKGIHKQDKYEGLIDLENGGCPLVRKRLDELRQEKCEQVMLLSKGTSMPRRGLCSQTGTAQNTDCTATISSTPNIKRRNRQRRLFETIQEALDSDKAAVITIAESPAPLLPALPLEMGLVDPNDHMILHDPDVNASVSDIFRTDISMVLYGDVTELKDGGYEKSRSGTGDDIASLSRYDVKLNNYDTCTEDVMISHPYADVIVCGDDITMARSDAAKSADLSKNSKHTIKPENLNFRQFMKSEAQNINFNSTDENSNSLTATFKSLTDVQNIDVAEFQLPKDFVFPVQNGNVQRWLASCTESEGEKSPKLVNVDSKDGFSEDICGFETAINRESVVDQVTLIGTRAVIDATPELRNTASSRVSCSNGIDPKLLPNKSEITCSPPNLNIKRKRAVVSHVLDETGPIKTAKSSNVVKRKTAQTKYGLELSQPVTTGLNNNPQPVETGLLHLANASKQNRDTALILSQSTLLKQSKTTAAPGRATACKRPPGPSGRKPSNSSVGSRKNSAAGGARKRKSSGVANSELSGLSDSESIASRTRSRTPLKSNRKGSEIDPSSSPKRVRCTPQRRRNDRDVFVSSDDESCASVTRSRAPKRSTRKYTPRHANIRNASVVTPVTNDTGTLSKKHKIVASGKQNSSVVKSSIGKKNVTVPAAVTNDNKENSCDSMTSHATEVNLVKRQIFKDIEATKSGPQTVSLTKSPTQQQSEINNKVKAVKNSPKQSIPKRGNTKSKVEISSFKDGHGTINLDDSCVLDQSNRPRMKSAKKRVKNRNIEYSPTHTGKIVMRNGSKSNCTKSSSVHIIRSSTDDDFVEPKINSKQSKKCTGCKTKSKQATSQRKTNNVVRNSSPDEHLKIPTPTANTELSPKRRGRPKKGSTVTTMKQYIESTTLSSLEFHSKPSRLHDSISGSSVANSIGSILDPDEIRLERCEFSNDYEYKSYVEEQDRRLALELQQDFDYFVEPNINSKQSKPSTGCKPKSTKAKSPRKTNVATNNVARNSSPDELLKIPTPKANTLSTPKRRGRPKKGSKLKKMKQYLESATTTMSTLEFDSEHSRLQDSVSGSSVASSIGSILDPDEIRLERCEFSSDYEYKSYVEEQDRRLALELQKDFDLEHRYNLNCIKRKGSVDEYQLRTRRRPKVPFTPGSATFAITH